MFGEDLQGLENQLAELRTTAQGLNDDSTTVEVLEHVDQYIRLIDSIREIIINTLTALVKRENHQ